MARPYGHLALALLLAAVTLAAQRSTAPWLPDRGDGTYRNPIIFADYSDPDVVRVDGDYYLVSSSFNAVPALPILHSRDLVNWTIIGHAAPRLPSPRYDTPQHGNGIWAPSLRFHGGRYWIYVGDPDLGIFMTSTRDPRGPWDPLTLVAAAQGWIDPCPLWDDDGRVYLVHAWAKSRAGFNGRLTVVELSADGTRVLPNTETTVFEGGDKHPTIEGPKFYKRNGAYYIFAPAGGVTNGWQTVLRSANVRGPYEDRIVLSQGKTAINGPHQGAWIDTTAGESWFVHFQDRGPYGRVTLLEPMAWRGDWPVIGVDPDGDGTGEPVTTFRKPVTIANAAATAPQTSDEFNASTLGQQWQWQANPAAAWSSLTARSGFLRLFAQPLAAAGGTLWSAPHLLLQKLPAETFTVSTLIDLSKGQPGDAINLVAFGLDYGLVRVTRSASGWRVEQIVCHTADQNGTETTVATTDGASRMTLRMTVEPGAIARFSFSIDGTRFQPIGDAFTLRPGKWVGAKIGLVATRDANSRGGFADVDWFRVTTR